MSPLILIVPWFGKWPAWINFFLESCRWNTEVNWLMISDQEPPDNRPPNVEFTRTTLSDFAARASEALGEQFSVTDPYKLCDLKPMLGHIVENDIVGYHSWGFSDLDVIYGNLREIFTDDLLERVEAVSTHPERITGHLAVFRNSPRLRHAYRRRPDWRQALTGDHAGFDESSFTRVFRTGGFFAKPFLIRPTLFSERYSTVDQPGPWIDGLPEHPRIWTWHAGRLTNDRDADERLYLHFMNWRSGRYRRPERGPAPWPLLDTLVHGDWRDAGARGFEISPAGITVLP